MTWVGSASSDGLLRNWMFQFTDVVSEEMFTFITSIKLYEATQGVSIKDAIRESDQSLIRQLHEDEDDVVEDAPLRGMYFCTMLPVSI